MSRPALLGLAGLLLAAGVYVVAAHIFSAAPPEPKPVKGAAVSVTLAKKSCFDDVTEIAGALVPKQEISVRPDREGWVVLKVAAEPGAKVAAGQVLAQLINPEQPGSGEIGVPAPAAGIVSKSSAVIGAIASQRAEPLFAIIGGGELEFSAQIPAKFLSKLTAGLPARVKVAGIGELTGKVRAVAGWVEPSTQLGEVRLSVEPDERLKAGMIGRAFVKSGRNCDGVAIPLSALLYSEEGTVVQIVRDDRVESRFVSTGLRSEGNVEVRQGISEGDMVVARAGAFLRDGDRVTPVAADEIWK